MKKLFSTLITLFMFAVAASAQDITGRVVDEKSQPLPFANVALLNSADSAFVAGAVTRDDGTFVITTNRTEGLLRVTSVGYAEKFVRVKQGNVGDIAMSPDVMALGEVVVKGYRPIIKQELGKTIFDIKNMPKIEALRAADVMKFAPGVVVAPDGGIFVGGKEAAVMVNDRQLTGDELKTFLGSLKATDIDHIEVMKSHGGEFDASIQGGVVNIITRRAALGLNGSADAYASMPESGYYSYTPTANLYFGSEHWNLYGTYSYTQSRTKQHGETTNDYLYNGTNHYSEGNYYGHLRQHVYRVGAMFTVTPQHTLGAEVNGISTLPVTDHGLNWQTYTIGGTPYAGVARQDYRWHSDFYNLVGFYRWNFDEQKSYLKLLLNYNNKNSITDNRLDTRYSTLKGYDVNETDIARARGNNGSAALDLRKNLAHGWSLRAGGKVMLSNRKSDFTCTDDLTAVAQTTNWHYRENIYAGYLGTSKTLGAWYFYGNLRVENTHVRGNAQGGVATVKNYTDLFPYLSVSYTSPKGINYYLYYTRTIYRPPFALMNGYVNRISDVLYDKGNPNLKAETTDFVGLEMSRGAHTLGANFRHKPNAITELFEVQNGITYHTNVNYGSQSEAMLSYSYSGKVLPWWQTNAYLVCTYTRIPKSYNKTHLLSGTISWNNRLQWERVGAFTVGLYCTSPTIVGNEHIKGMATVDLSAERAFLNKALTLKVGVDDLLNGSRVRVTNRVPTLNYQVNLKDQTRQFYLRLTYNFSTRAKASRSSIQNDNAVKDRL